MKRKHPEFFSLCGFLWQALLLTMLMACDHGSKSMGEKKVIGSKMQLQAMFEKTKTVCFGRFQIELPLSTTVVWGATDIPLGVSVHKNGFGKVKALAQGLIDEMKSEKAINHDGVPLLIEVNRVAEPNGQIIVGYEDFEAIDGLRITGYFELNDDGFIVESRPLRPMKEKVLENILSIAQRLRMRGENEIPEQAGNCIEHAFLPDREDAGEDNFSELISIGFRFKEFPDAHLSAYIAPSNIYNPKQDSLEDQMVNVKEDLTRQGGKFILDKTKFFREGERKINGWETGYEVLMRSPDEKGSLSHHDFHLRFIGRPRDRLKPYADIRFQTGVANNAAGATKASLTDEEAIAIWDKITSSIRVRPTSDKAVKTSDASRVPLRPLGELAATGRTCPQSGWWEASEDDHVVGDRRKHIEVGELMPHATSRANPSLWQKIKGEQPVYRAATVWKLVGYDDVSLNVKARTTASAIALTLPDGMVPAKMEAKGLVDKGGDNAIPEQKG